MDAMVRVRSLVWFATGVVVALLATVVVVEAWRADAAPGDTDATLVPINPCRLVDTRQAGQIPLGSGETRTIDAHGTHGPIAGSQCTIPADAVGLSMNVTALDATTVGTYLTIWPDGVTLPDASSLNPAPGQPPTPNAVTTPISAAGRFNVFNFSGTVQVIVDVNGYYTNTSLAELASRVTAAEAGIAANVDGVAVNKDNLGIVAGFVVFNGGRIDVLDAREPFAVTAWDHSQDLGYVPVTEVVSVMVTAPVAGHVTVNSTTGANESWAEGSVQCAITQAPYPGGPPAWDPDYIQHWKSPGPSAPRAQLAGTRTFEIAAGENVEYELVCFADGFPSVYGSVLTAIFTPEP